MPYYISINLSDCDSLPVQVVFSLFLKVQYTYKYKSSNVISMGGYTYFWKVEDQQPEGLFLIKIAVA